MESIDRFAAHAFPLAAVWFVLLTALRTAVVLRRGYRVELGTAKGDPRRGVLYALTFAMLPWKKDSTRRHAWTYVGGMGMHLGVFLSVTFAVGGRLWTWPAALVPAFGIAAGVGLVSTLGLFLKRATRPAMRPISSPDDFISNLLVQFYLLGACLSAFQPAWHGLWRLAAVMLLIYIPLGKIYHMFLFFAARVLFGLQFGRRGVLQHDLPLSY